MKPDCTRPGHVTGATAYIAPHEASAVYAFINAFAPILGGGRFTQPGADGG